VTAERQAGEIAFLLSLEEVIRKRIKEPRPDSYVAALAANGDRHMAQKVGEEAVEVALAATAGDAREQLEEAADLLFHLLVLLNAKGLRLADVTRILEQRHRATRADNVPPGAPER
jgi:phosphoribosyl-ATP pyrophosphohydrolase